MVNDYLVVLEIAKEVERFVVEDNLSYLEALKKAKDMYLGEENYGESKMD